MKSMGLKQQKTEGETRKMKKLSHEIVRRTRGRDTSSGANALQLTSATDTVITVTGRVVITALTLSIGSVPLKHAAGNDSVGTIAA